MTDDTKATGSVLLISGETNWDDINRKKKAEEGTVFLAPRLFQLPFEERVVKCVSSNTACHNIIITESGAAYAFGRNEHGQLGTGDYDARSIPFKIDISEKIIDAACGRNHTLLLTETNKVWSMGDNKGGQCGVKTPEGDILNPVAIKSFDLDCKITSLACGADFSMALTEDGKLLSFGSPQYGALGHGSDEQSLVTGNKLVFERQPHPSVISGLSNAKITKVACGVCHTVALTDEGKIYTWGSGDYGRLGHNVQEDSHSPKELVFFSSKNNGCNLIACGATCSMVVTKNGQIYLWGKWKTTGDGSSGNPWMYPRPLYDLSGWETITSIDAGSQSLFVIADKSSVSWGQGCVGELGHGDDEAKSVTKPKICEPLDGVHIQSIAAGVATTLWVVDDIKYILDFPKYTPPEVVAKAAEEESGKMKRGRPAKKGAAKKFKKS